MNYKIYPLKNGECTIAGNNAFLGGDSSERYSYYLYLWLIKGWKQPILVDSGLKDVEGMNREAAHVLAKPVKQSSTETAQAQLSRFGISPEDIGYVFVTHLHFDHVNELGNYTNSQIVVSRRGLDAATAFPGWKGSWAPWDVLDGLKNRWKDRVLAVDDAKVLPGISTIWLGGHTPCSQAVIVKTRSGKAVITGDTVSLYANIEKNIPVGVAVNHNECLEAMAKVRQIATIILPSHDPEVLNRFPNGVIE